MGGGQDPGPSEVATESKRIVARELNVSKLTVYYGEIVLVEHKVPG